MGKTEQQESVEGIIENWFCDANLFQYLFKYSKFQEKLKKFEQQLDSFYKEKYLGGLEERIEILKGEILTPKGYAPSICEALDKVLSIIQETKNDRRK